MWTVISFRDRHKSMVNSWSEDVISTLMKSATKSISIDIYKKALVWTLHQLNQDHELEDFVDGIPGLYGSEAFVTPDYSDVQHSIRPILADLPGPASSDAPLPWSIIWLAQRGIESKLPKPIQRKRTQACLRALYYIPGAIREVLGAYTVGKHYCLEILPLLNSPESLEIIDELWNTPNDDVALSVRCVAAVVTAFIVTPPRRVLDHFLAPEVCFIGDDEAGQQFLAKRLCVPSNAYGGAALESHPSDSMRLQNIVNFLADINDTLQYMKTQGWTSDDTYSIRRERRALFRARHTKEYHDGTAIFGQKGDRASSGFVAAAQQDLITLTLEILAQDPVANAATSQREAFRDVSMQIGQVTMTEAMTQAQRQVWEHIQARTHVLPERPVFEALAMRQVGFGAVDSMEMIERPLEPVLLELSQSQGTEIPTPQSDDAPPIQMSVPSPAPVETVGTNETLGPAGVGTPHRRQPPPTHAPPSLLISQYSMSSSAGIATAVGELGNPPL